MLNIIIFMEGLQNLPRWTLDYIWKGLKHGLRLKRLSE